MIYRGPNNEYVELKEIKNESIIYDNELSLPLIFLWVKGDNININFEGKDIQVENNTIICLTAFHNFVINEIEYGRIIKFNKEFYCVLHHDDEVSCKGLLFFGASQIPMFKIPDDELEKFETFWKMFRIEMQTDDEHKLEMLQMMLKRFIILCTRIYKNQNNFQTIEKNEVDIVREFNFLVEQHFKTKHTVKEYATQLNKSPKTLSNLFRNASDKSPLQIIHERRHIEAKRMLKYSDKSIKEISYELGFEDIQTFSRFFKKLESVSPSDFKKLTI